VITDANSTSASNAFFVCLASLMASVSLVRVFISLIWFEAILPCRRHLPPVCLSISELPFAHHIANRRFFLTSFRTKAFPTRKLALPTIFGACFSREPARPGRSKNRGCQCVG